MTLTFHALWMLCAFGLVVHAATSAHRVRDLVSFLAGFTVATVIASPQRLPDPVWAGVISAGAAVAILFRPRLAILAAAWGGALGGMLTALLEVQGLHPIAAIAATALLALVTIGLSRMRPAFAPDALRDEALLVVSVLGLVVAIAPGVIDGWQAAANLTIESATPDPVRPIPVWTLALVGAATLLGAMYSLWSRR